ncbi:MAG: hypothetical protein NVS1B14_07070 [Vulcanimicrobiaceae bacterium]
MEEPLADVKARIPGFAGYADEVARRAADEQIRAVVGEAVAELRDRYPDAFTGDVAQAYDAAILRCQFMNQQAFKSFEYQSLDDAAKTQITRADQALLRAAGEAQKVRAEDLRAYLQSVQTAFDARDAALSARSRPQ